VRRDRGYQQHGHPDSPVEAITGCNLREVASAVFGVLGVVT
jgi:hypothetical protein